MSERRGRPFVKGQSGNPKGRPRSGEALADYIRELAGPDGKVYVDKLHALAVGKHQDTRSRLTAIATLLERGYGKPAIALEHSGSIASVSSLSTDELRSELEALLDQLDGAV